MKASCPTGLPPVNAAGMPFEAYAECVSQRLFRRLGPAPLDLSFVHQSWSAAQTIRDCVERLVEQAWEVAATG